MTVVAGMAAGGRGLAGTGEARAPAASEAVGSGDMLVGLKEQQIPPRPARAGRVGVTFTERFSAGLKPRPSNLLLGGLFREASVEEADAAAEIRGVLEMQTAAWNRGDIDTFMTGYWKSDETEFIGANGVTRGWQAVLERYKRGYPDRKAMGHLTFANLEIHAACADAAFVIGEYHLERETDKPAGVFTLNFRRFEDGWKIVADHTTAFAAAAAAKSN